MKVGIVDEVYVVIPIYERVVEGGKEHGQRH
jgi:hypothetical protein